WLKTLYRKRAVTWPFIFYTIIWTLSFFKEKKACYEKKLIFNSFFLSKIQVKKTIITEAEW
ncbi:hypothetical protein, partial [Enterococcus faecalis]|uniref:hypothetical protein n=1 Tax=Enterococcus faecalis TaxID=1351 RepID=UPI00321B6AFD